MAKKEVVNLYEVLGVKRNATFGEIKVAYIAKVEAITNLFKSGTTTEHTANDLILANKALETFSTSIGRYLHDCEIDGEEPNFDGGGEDYYAGSFVGNNDFTEKEDELMVEWLKQKIGLYTMAYKQGAGNRFDTVIKDEEFKQILEGMNKICLELQENLKKQITPRKQLHC